MKFHLLTFTAISLTANFSLADPAKEAPAKPLPTPESEFKRYDENADKKLSIAELSVDRKVEHVTKLMTRRDANKDGFLQLSECRVAMVLKYPKAVFNEYDSNNDGKINRAEFAAQIKSRDVAASWFYSLDWNQNKKLSFNEFKKSLEKKSNITKPDDKN
ncbi:MAG: Ca2+-binding EF-hand superfamily protein [Cryomorphaceae bacterium]|jgi:Ca2+-binding EF-hand superfamily protein